MAAVVSATSRPPNETPFQNGKSSHETSTNLPDQDPASDSDTDSLLAKLESELDLTEPTEDDTQNPTLSPTIASLQAARISEIQSQSQNALLSGRTILAPQSKGLQVPSSEEVLIRATADAPAAVVVFYSVSFASSVRMRDLASDLARHYAVQNSASVRDDGDAAETVFFAAEAEKCEWLCRRLKIKALPVVVGYADGKEVGRLVGFEGLKAGENASWQALAWVIGRWEGGWNGTLGKGSGGSVLGSRWAEWAGGDGASHRDREQNSDEDSNEDEKETRRRLGYIGGSSKGTHTGLKTGRQRQGIGLDEDDDWE